MALLKQKTRHLRDDSYNSSLSIFTFGPKTETNQSPECSEIEFTKKDTINVSSLITLISKHQRISSDAFSGYTDEKSISNDSITFCSCKCLIL